MTALVASLRCNDLEDELDADFFFASMKAVRLFLRAGAVIKFILRTASTLENTDGELRALRNFLLARISLFVKRKRHFAPGCRGSNNKHD